MHRTSQFRPAWKGWAAVLLTTHTLSGAALAEAPAPKAQEAEGKATPKNQPKSGGNVPDDGASAPEESHRKGESLASEQASSDGSEAAPSGSPATPEQTEAARSAMEAGKAAYESENYEEAAAAFQEAHELIPSPHAQYWLARSWDQSDPQDEQAARSAKAYGAFLNHPGAEHVGEEALEFAKERYEDLRSALPATVTLESEPSGASITLNGEPQEGVTPYTFEGKAGEYEVGLSLPGYEDVSVTVQAEGGATVTQEVTLAETPPPPTPQPEEQPEASEGGASEDKAAANMVPAIVTLGLGGAGLISGTVFGIMALNSKSKFKDDPTTANADAAERNALIADMSFGIALTLGITGVVLWTARDGEEDLTAKAKGQEFVFAPYASPRGAGAAARWTF